MTPCHPVFHAFSCFSWLLLFPVLASAQPIIELTEFDGQPVIAVSNIKTVDYDRAPMSLDDWRSLLTVIVATAADDQPAMLGTHRAERDRLLFIPRFPLKPGLDYRATFQPPGGEPIIQVVALPRPASTPATRVTQIYPTAEELPQNLLRIYIHFSAPMSRGRSYRQVQLFETGLSDGDRRVEFPFVEVTPELWDESGTRLTVLFDPGRIKHGLRPNKELGPPLEASKSYALVIDDGWRDAAGNRLAESFRKPFRVAAIDDTQPDTARWAVAAPPADTREPLRIDFDEPLDHGMLGRVIEVVQADGAYVAGTIEVSGNETRWHFTPDRPWTSGTYRVTVDPTLEDSAGNSLARPFEVQMDEATQKQTSTGPRLLEFETTAAGSSTDH